MCASGTNWEEQKKPPKNNNKKTSPPPTLKTWNHQEVPKESQNRIYLHTLHWQINRISSHPLTFSKLCLQFFNSVHQKTSFLWIFTAGILTVLQSGLDKLEMLWQAGFLIFCYKKHGICEGSAKLVGWTMTTGENTTGADKN